MRASWTAILDRVVVALLAGLVRTYQRFVSPFLRPTCRFRPTCSVYFLASLKTHGAVRGTLRGLRRICRCHPWSRGGWDPP